MDFHLRMACAWGENPLWLFFRKPVASQNLVFSRSVFPPLLSTSDFDLQDLGCACEARMPCRSAVSRKRMRAGIVLSAHMECFTSSSFMLFKLLVIYYGEFPMVLRVVLTLEPLCAMLLSSVIVAFYKHNSYLRSYCLPLDQPSHWHDWQCGITVSPCSLCWARTYL